MNCFSRFAEEEAIAEIREEQIPMILPHRHPILFVSFIASIDLKQKKITAKYFVPYDPFWEKGHFPDRPIMPGMFIGEAGNQTFAILVLKVIQSETSKNPRLRESSYKFRGRPVVPGDILLIKAEITRSKGALYEGRVKIYIEEENGTNFNEILVAEGMVTGCPR